MAVPTLIKEPIIHHGRIAMPYRHSAGIAGSKFLHGLKEGKILAVKCNKCSRVYVPPKIVCGECFELMEEWVELDGKGALLTYTEITYPSVVHPVKPPFMIGAIQLDGADTALIHLLGEIDGKKVKTGMRLKPVFKKEPEGTILDLKYFKPV